MWCSVVQLHVSWLLITSTINLTSLSEYHMPYSTPTWHNVRFWVSVQLYYHRDWRQFNVRLEANQCTQKSAQQVIMGTPSPTWAIWPKRLCKRDRSKKEIGKRSQYHAPLKKKTPGGVETGNKQNKHLNVCSISTRAKGTNLKTK